MRTMAVVSPTDDLEKAAVAAELAAAIAGSGEDVLVVDLDPRGRASAEAGLPFRAGPSAADVVEGRSTVAAARRATPRGFDLVPGSPRLVFLEGGQVGEGLSVGLARALAAAAGDYAVALVDAPPASETLLFEAALVAADAVLVVVDATSLGLAEVTDALGELGGAALDLRASFQVRVLPTAIDGRSPLERNFLVALRRRFAGIVHETLFRGDGEAGDAFRVLAGQVLEDLRRGPIPLARRRAVPGPAPAGIGRAAAQPGGEGVRLVAEGARPWTL